MQEGRTHITFMQDNIANDKTPSISDHLHLIVEQMLGGEWNKSAYGQTLLGGTRPPFDFTKPNQHDSKAEFKLEYDSVTNATQHVYSLLKELVDDEGSKERSDMLDRLRSSIDQVVKAHVLRRDIESPLELALSNMAIVGGTNVLVLFLLDFRSALLDRKQELEVQREAFWSLPHRAPDYYARTIALRLAQLYARETGRRPTYGSSGEHGDPSTAYSRALQEVFEVLGIESGIRTHAEWAVKHLTEADMRSAEASLAGLMASGALNQPSSDVKEIARALLLKGDG